jgi:hypothetical protein
LVFAGAPLLTNRNAIRVRLRFLFLRARTAQFETQKAEPTMTRRKIRRVLAALQERFFRKRSRIVRWRAFGRNRAAALRKIREPAFRAVGATIRRPRGDAARSNSVWRRLSLGTNRISSFGVWRIHARRAAPRANRGGETRWHHMRGRYSADWPQTSSMSNITISTPPVAKI